MIIMLAKPQGSELGEGTSSWALQGGNDPRILVPILNYIAKRTEVCFGESEQESFRKEDELASWCQYAEEVATEVFPDKKWNASDVFFYFVPDSSIKVTFFKGLSGEEVCAYWIAGDTTAGFRIAEEIPLSSIHRYI